MSLNRNKHLMVFSTKVAAIKHCHSQISWVDFLFISRIVKEERSAGPPLKPKKAEGNTQRKGKGSQETIVVSFQFISKYQNMF